MKSSSDSPPPLVPGGTAQREAVLQLWLLNLAFGVFLGIGYLGHVPHSESPRLWVFALPALVSSVLTLTLAPGLLFALWARYSRAPRLLGFVQAFVWGWFHVVLYTDTRIYNTFRYHFGPQVFNVLFNRGSEDAVFLGFSVWASVFGGFFGVACVELFLWRKLLHGTSAASFAREGRRLLRPTMVCFALLVPTVFLEKSIYAHSDLNQDRELTTLSRLFPMYPSLPVKDFASTFFGVEVPERPTIELGGVKLAYPLIRPELPADGPRPNVLMIVIDCLRNDMLSEECTPGLAELAAESRNFKNHLSGGNSTRFGLFSLLYSLHGSYWFPVLNEQRSPVLIDELLDSGYDTRVFSSANMNYPELRSTAWVRIQDRVDDDFPSDHGWERDRMAADACMAWLAQCAQPGSPGSPGSPEAASREPFFGFLMLDAPHQKYSYPPDTGPFQPAAEDIDYMKMSLPGGPPAEVMEAVFNRYRNAVHYADSLASAVVARLDELGLGEDTLVIVTGDHGEEFMEHGYFGHTSTHSPPQVRVPFLMRGPGVEPGAEARPTSHLDVAVTIVEMLGADPAQRGGWAMGENLLDPLQERRRVVAGWNELGLWTPDGILRIPLGSESFDIELYDYEWQFIPQDWNVLDIERAPLHRLAEECNRFLE